jgi:signal transduction histidine kinase
MNLPHIDLSNSLDDVMYCGAIVVIVVIGWFSTKLVRASLKESRKSEKNLTAENTILEIKVDERTMALRETQTKWLAEIARTAEFGRVAEGLFHDLMSPLTSVALHMEKLKNKNADVSISQSELESTRAYLDKAMQASQKMGHFMKNIRRQMSRDRNADDHALTDEVVDVGQELATAIDLLKYKARNANVRIDIVEIDTKAKYIGNPLRMLQLFSNLISNAIDACEKITDREKVVKIKITAAKGDTNGVDKIIISVSDNGVGIPSKYLPRIFDQFFSTKSPHDGTGIGLATVKKIAEEELHGKVTVTSTENVGTEFIVTFPIHVII